MADNTIQTATDGNSSRGTHGEQFATRDGGLLAEWCRPCHMLAPTVAEIAHDYAGSSK